MRCQHRADLHVGDVARLALVEADQNRALLGYIAHRQPCPIAVAPGRSLDGAQQPFRLDLGQMPQVVFQHPLLDGHLGRGVQVLHLAAAARARVQAKVRTAGTHTLRTFTRNSAHVARFPIVLLARDADLHPFARQGTFDEDHLALPFGLPVFQGAMRHSLCFEVERFDLQPMKS